MRVMKNVLSFSTILAVYLMVNGATEEIYGFRFGEIAHSDATIDKNYSLSCISAPRTQCPYWVERVYLKYTPKTKKLVRIDFVGRISAITNEVVCNEIKKDVERCTKCELMPIHGALCHQPNESCRAIIELFIDKSSGRIHLEIFRYYLECRASREWAEERKERENCFSAQSNFVAKAKSVNASNLISDLLPALKSFGGLKRREGLLTIRGPQNKNIAKRIALANQVRKELCEQYGILFDYAVDKDGYTTNYDDFGITISGLTEGIDSCLSEDQNCVHLIISYRDNVEQCFRQYRDSHTNQKNDMKWL